MRYWIGTLIFGVALLSSGFSCTMVPPTPECIVTIGFDELADALWQCPKGDRVCARVVEDSFIVSACRDPKGKHYLLPASQLDGSFSYLPEDRERLINWIKQSCRKR